MSQRIRNLSETPDIENLGLSEENTEKHRTVITLDTGDRLSENELSLLDTQIRFICEAHLIPVINLTIENEKK